MDRPRVGGVPSGIVTPAHSPGSLDHFGDLAEVIRAQGTDAFYPLLLRWLGRLFPNDFWFLTDYGRNRKPNILLDTWERVEAKRFYYSNVCQFDPVFFALGDQSLMPGTSIGMMRREFGIHPRYAHYMEHVAHIADELMILLPRADGSFLGLCFDREQEQFTSDEISDARRISALLTEIVALHWRRLSDAASAAQSNSELDAASFEDSLVRFSAAHGLTPRETEITGLSLRGYANGAIAKGLGITAGAVKNHKLRLYRKLDITSERELVPLFLDLQPQSAHRSSSIDHEWRVRAVVGLGTNSGSAGQM